MFICLRLFTHLMRFADSLARASAGRSMLARIAIIAMTTNSSMRVNARRRPLFPWKLLRPDLFRFKKNRLLTIAFMHFISFSCLVRIFSATFTSTTYAYDEKAMDADCAGRRARRLFALPQ